MSKKKTLLFAALTAASLMVGHQARAAEQFFPGVIRVDVYRDIGGATVADLRSSPKFPGSPDEVYFMPYLEWQNIGFIEDPPVDLGDNYGAKLTGVVVPSESDSFYFHLVADDAAELWLSTDESPSNARLIVSEPEWNQRRNWAGDYVDRQIVRRSELIPVQSGQRYYFQGLLKEAGGGDYFSVAMLKEGETPVSQDLTIGEVGTLPVGTDEIGYFGLTAKGFLIEPQDQTVNAGQPVTFMSQAVDAGMGTEVPTGYQWLKNGQEIAGEINGSYSIAAAPASDNGAKLQVRATFADGTTVTSREATLTVESDSTPPSVVDIRVNATQPHNQVNLVFSEPVDQSTVSQAANFTIAPGITVQSAQAVSLTEVALTTSPLQRSTPYTLTLGSNVKDFSGNSASAEPNEFQIRLLLGTALYERWHSRTDGDAVAWEAALESGDLPPPNVVELRPSFTAPRDVGVSDYGARVRTLFTPPSTGNYVFFMSTDDFGFLYLSTDDDPANKYRIAAEPQWGNANEWAPNAQRDAVWAENRSDYYLDTLWPQGPTITLQAGQPYYMEVIFHQGGGGDGGEVTYKLEAEEDPLNGTVTRMTENLIGWPAVVLGAFEVEATRITVNPRPPSNRLVVTFEAAMGAGAGVAANYTISPGVTVQSVEVIDSTRVALTTSELQLGTEYTLSGPNVTSLNDAPLAPVTFTITETNGAIYERWNNRTEGTAAAWEAALASGDLPSPNVAEGQTSFFATRNTQTDNYGARVTSLFNPPTTGEYVFFMSTDDHGFLYLSTDEDPANKKLLTAEPSWGGANAWGPSAERNADAPENRSDSGWVLIDENGVERSNQWPGGTINLNADQNYYIELIFREGGGGDGGEVTFKLANEPDPASGTASRMTADVLAMPVRVVQIGGGGPGPGPGDSSISISRDAAGVIQIQYEGTLYSAPDVTGPFTPVAGATSPYTVSPSEERQFFQSAE